MAIDIKKIKEHVAYHPHVKEVWVKNEQIYFSKIHGATILNLDNVEEDKVTTKKTNKKDAN